MKTKSMAGLLLLLLGGGVSLGLLAKSPEETRSPVRVRQAHYVMGTIFEITAYGLNEQQTVRAVEEAFAAIRHTDQVMSHYKKDSDLMRLNRRGKYEPVTVPVELYAVLQESVRYGELTQGAFDVTVGPLVRLWERSAEQGRVPTEAEIQQGKIRVGFRHIRFLPDSRVQFDAPGAEINLGGIGKGWAVDRAVEILRDRGVEAAFVSAGTSTVYGLGSFPGEEGWRVDVLDPCNPDGTAGVFWLKDGSLSTSANTERYWEIGGVRYSHILDPRSGRPVEPLASATVVAPTATESDALSTAVYVMGLPEGARFLRRRNQKGLLVWRPSSGECVAQEEPGGEFATTSTQGRTYEPD